MFTKPFKQLTKNDVSIAGGKGASLGEMTNVKIPVLPGFVVLTDALAKFLEEADLKVAIDSILNTKVNYEDINSVEDVSVQIRDLMADAEFPQDIARVIFRDFGKLKIKYVAVRSSATVEDSSFASWAGQLESYLNVEYKDLLDSVKKSWSSLFTPRAIFYRYENKLSQQKISAAVIIQEMIQSEVAGVCFTTHPVSKDKDQMIIEAAYGLGEVVVRGMITPDSYIVYKDKDGEFKILDKNISRQKIMITKTMTGTNKVQILKTRQAKQKLSDEQIIKLAKLCRQIAKHYSCPQDIEWALAGGKLYIMQSRPITTL